MHTSSSKNTIKHGPAAFSTEELASGINILPQSIRKRLCQTGSYFGLRPLKLPNGRLLWPADSIAQLTSEACK